MGLLVTTAPPAPPGSSRGHGETVRQTDMTFASISSNFRSVPFLQTPAPIGCFGSFTLRSGFRFVTSQRAFRIAAGYVSFVPFRRAHGVRT
jgi:hypothetical protein